MSTEEFTPADGPPVQSQTTFESPIINAPAEVNLERSVTIWASGSVTADDANNVGYITVSKDDIREAIGIGKDAFIPALDRASISHYFNPTSQRMGIRVKQGKGEKAKKLVEDAAHARNPRSKKMEAFTAVLPSQTQGNIQQELRPINQAKNMNREERETARKWRGLRYEDLTDGVIASSIDDPENPGTQKLIKYEVPLVKTNGEPQPLAYMLEKNKESFPGFAGDGIRDKIHDYEGVHYYSIPPQYLNYLVGSMKEHLIDKNSMTLDDDLVLELTPLSPIMASSVRNATGKQRQQPMERMVAIQLDFANLDMSEVR